jgi:hypothetical protein
MANGYIDMQQLDTVRRFNGFSYSPLGKIWEREFMDGQPR